MPNFHDDDYIEKFQNLHGDFPQIIINLRVSKNVLQNMIYVGVTTITTIGKNNGILNFANLVSKHLKRNINNILLFCNVN